MDGSSQNQRLSVQINSSPVIPSLIMTTITSLILVPFHRLRNLMCFNREYLLTTFKIWIHSWKMTKPGYVESQLEWVRKKTHGEKNPKNFTTDWSNGITLCTLIDAIEPGSCPRCDLLQPDRAIENVEKAIRVLKEKLKVDPLLDPRKVVVMESERSISYLLSRLKIISAKRNLIRALKKPLIQVTDEKGRSKPFKLANGTGGECFVKGMGLQLAVVGRKARFNIFFENASRLNLVVEVIGPNNSKGFQTILEDLTALWKYSSSSQDRTTIVDDLNKIPITCEIISSQKLSVSYIPVQTGKHRLSVLWEDMHICGSPFTVQVDNSSETLCQSPSEIESSSSLPLCRFSSSRKIPLKTKVLSRKLIEKVLVINGVERPFPNEIPPGFVNFEELDRQTSEPESETPRSDLEEEVSIPEVLIPGDIVFEQDIICNYVSTMNFSSYFPDTMEISTTNQPASLSYYLDGTVDHDAVNLQFEQLIKEETSFYDNLDEKPRLEPKVSSSFLEAPLKQPCIRDRKRTFEERKLSRSDLPPKPAIALNPDVVKTSVKDRLKFWESLSTANEEKKRPPIIKVSRPPKQRKLEQEPPTMTPDSETDSGIVTMKPKEIFPPLLKDLPPVAMRRSGSFPVVTPQSDSQECSMSVSNLQRSINTRLAADSRPASGFIDDDYEECLFSGSMVTLSESRRSSKDVSRVDLLASALRAFGSGLHYATVGLKSNFTVDTQDGTTGYLSVAIQAADPFSISKISIKTVSRNMFHISYLATIPGYIRIHVRWADKDIPGSPFECRVAEHY